MGIATAVITALAAAMVGGQASAELSVTAVVVRSVAIPVLAGSVRAAGEARGASAETSSAEDAAVAASGSTNAVFFTDGAPPALALRAVSGRAVASAATGQAER
jgi:hypothetical protein